MFQLHPYMTRDNIRVLPAGIKTLEQISVALLLQSYLEIGTGVSQLSKFETVLPKAVRSARAVFEDQLISGLGQAKASTETVVNKLTARLELNNFQAFNAYFPTSSLTRFITGAPSSAGVSSPSRFVLPCRCSPKNALA